MEGSEQKCKQCKEKQTKIDEQHQAINLVQKRFRDVVSALKNTQEHLKIKEKLLLETSIAATKGLGLKQQESITSLENNLAELSQVCGDYERERLRDKAKIDSLESQLAAFIPGQISVKESFDQEINKVVMTRSRYSQTDAEEIQPPIVIIKEFKDEETQVTSEYLFDHNNVTTPKKPELAVVNPTHREDVPFPEYTQQRSLDLENPQSFEPNSQDISYTAPSVRATSRVSSVVHGNNTGVSLFYVNELARKEIELAESRLQAREYECALRELQWKCNVDTYRLQTKVEYLEKQHQNIHKDKNFHPNMTYVKNVLLRFINTKDKQQKQVMINALLTALNAGEETNS